MRGGWRIPALAAAALVMLVGIVVSIRSGSGDKEDMGSRGSSAPAPPLEQPTFVRSGSTNIYVVDVATRSLEQLTSNRGEQFASEPVWSPRGKIVFTETPSAEQPARLFVINPDGSGRKRVPTRVSGLSQPSWAPDGRKLVMSQFQSGLHIVDLASGSVSRLKNTGPEDDAPAWSPDGSTIVFQRRVTATNLDLYRITPTGTGLRRLTRDPLQQINPAWSPDGSRLAFAEQQKTGNWAISSMKLDGSERKLLTDPEISSQDPSWSPDGRQIALLLQGPIREWLAVIDAAGGRPARVTPRSLVAPTHPSWSPDSKRIVFASHRAERPPPRP